MPPGVTGFWHGATYSSALCAQAPSSASWRSCPPLTSPSPPRLPPRWQPPRPHETSGAPAHLLLGTLPMRRHTCHCTVMMTWPAHGVVFSCFAVLGRPSAVRALRCRRPVFGLACPARRTLTTLPVLGLFRTCDHSVAGFSGLVYWCSLGGTGTTPLAQSAKRAPDILLV